LTRFSQRSVMKDAGKRPVYSWQLRNLQRRHGAPAAFGG
jgi:hypothetical protein